MAGNTFKQLYLEEQARLGLPETATTAPTESNVEIVFSQYSQEPRVKHTPVDRAGIALSGGGIRSATFNLGLLQGLHELKMIPKFDYLSTVSGGGYIGGWWSAWLSRVTHPDKPFPDPFFPTPTTPGDEILNKPEAEEVRHLREFSNFLAPRLGFFESETWNAVVAIFSAVLPALAVAFAVIALAVFGWLGLVYAFTWSNPLLPLVVVPMAVAIVGELFWIRGRKSDHTNWAIAWCAGFTLFMLLSVVLLACWLPDPLGWLLGTGGKVYVQELGWQVEELTQKASWWASIGVQPIHRGFHFNPQLFTPALLWILPTLAMIPGRLIAVRFLRPNCYKQPWSSVILPAMDRATQRFIALGLVWSTLGVIWLTGCYLQELVGWLGALTTAGGGSFAALRNWISQRSASNKSSGVNNSLAPKLKQLSVQLLAYGTLGLACTLVVAVLVRACGPETAYWIYGAGAAVGLILLAILFLDPTELSLHAFYRNRIVRTYLGASNPQANRNGSTVASENRQTDTRIDDDVPLENIAPPFTAPKENPPRRPLHLICCAANDLSGDTLPTLSRGCRSAVLSGLGFSIGNLWQKETGLTLGSALTASAAAFNSNMGSISMRLGGAVTFMMTALNLRLGLWVPNPAQGQRPGSLFPGWFFLRELFGRTQADFRPEPCSATTPPELKSAHVHLSDGAHFENLALYELVRRHCRYILASDCSADPSVGFDDFANAIRRIREDFGIDIEIDLAPLKPGPDGLCRQHLAVGTIHYDPATTSGLDKGILLYFKPSIVGDETGDVLQYKNANPAFPHEPTADQFYNEAQWESYRRLGKHSSRQALATAGVKSSLEDLFGCARSKWHPSPAGLNPDFTELTRRFTELESQLRASAPAALTRQIFPELDQIAPTGQPQPPLTSAEMEQTVHLLQQAIQLMEDIWSITQMEAHSSHPANLGWLNYFQRWSSAPVFRLWWPLLKPQFNPWFRRFMETRFQLPATRPLFAQQIPKSDPAGLTAGLAWKMWNQLQPALNTSGKLAYYQEISLEDPTRNTRYQIQVAVALITISPTSPAVEWNAHDIFLLPGLAGSSGFDYNFINGLIDHLQHTHQITEFSVTLGGTKRLDNPGIRQEHLNLIQFYRLLGFHFQPDTNRLQLSRR